ncbi:hypothetical protein BHE74_00003153 [Ensete ventricosum]|nr:hypothetical protein GW17_00041795 [Ensete ventricosum]RWW87999.1 hypothetical protein BHE74_00003153 [Ensete ventricosum]
MRLRVYMALLRLLGVSSLVRLAYYLARIIAPPRGVETSLVEMVSSISFTTSGLSSNSSSVSSPWTEECRPNCSSGGQSRPPSSSSSVMTQADVKALQALEVMKSCHGFDSIISLESLGTIREHYSIPAEYVLHAPAPGQRPYHLCHSGFSISVDSLEVGLRFPLHPVISECLG